MDPEVWSPVSNKCDLKCHEDMETVWFGIDKFSPGGEETLPKPPANNAALISEASHEHSDPQDMDCLAKEMGSSATRHGVDSKRKGWLSRIAADRTALMKNLPLGTVPQNKKPIFGSNEMIFKFEPATNRWVIFCNNKDQPTQYQIENGIQTAKTIKRLTAAKNRLEDQSLRQISANENLSDPMVLLIDQRTATTELLFELLRKIFRQISNRLVIFDSSVVNWDQDKLASIFTGCQVVEIPRDTFPVKIIHLEEPTSDYLYAAAFMALQIHTNEEKPTGDIIVFLASEEEIYRVELIIKGMRLTQGDTEDLKLRVLPVYNRGINDTRLLEPKLVAKNRKVFLTTDKAQAMFNFENILYVIDCGFETRVAENRSLETNSLVVAPISQDLAAKRAAQAGRVELGGRCYRLYTEAAYLQEMVPETEPEILRANLGEALLLREALGLRSHFLDDPKVESMSQGSRQLCFLGAFDNEMRITSLGRGMAEFPVPPVLARILIAASLDFGCSKEAVTIVAMVMTGNVFERPEEEEKLAEADLKRVGFIQTEGDHLTLLEIFKSCKLNQFSNRWCSDNFIWYRPMNRARGIRKELISIMKRLKLKIVSAEIDYTKIRKAITAGLFFHAAKWDTQGGCYRAVNGNRRLHINPRSALFQRQPSCVVFDDLHVNSDGEELMIGVTAVDHEWLLELAPHYFSEVGFMMNQREKRGRGSPDADQSNEPKRDKLSA